MIHRTTKQTGRTALPETTTEAPQDPGAPVKKTLPSGKVVSIRSHRTLLGSDIAAAMAAQPGGAWMTNSVAMRNHFMAVMITELEPGRAGTAVLTGARTPDGTPESVKAFDAALAAVLAQRADDYRAMYDTTNDAISLVLGLSVISDIDDLDKAQIDDPKAPTTPTSGSGPASGDDDPT